MVKRALLGLIGVALFGALPGALIHATDLHNVLTDYVITSWNNKEGLPPGVVWALTQDTDGYLWVGNDVGLFRFDGERFVEWNALSADPLPSTAVRSLLIARDGTLWIGFGGNAGIGHVVGGRLHIYAESEGVGPGTIVVLLEDTRGGIWAGNNSGLFRFADGRFARQDIGRAGQQSAVLSGFVDQSSALLIGTSTGLLRSDPPYSQFGVIETTDDAVRAIADDDHGGIWVSDSVTGFRRLARTPEDAHSDTQTPERGRGTRLLRDRRGDIWTATGGQGLWRIHGAQIERATSLSGLLGDGVYALLEDRDGNVWAGTTEGLNRLMPRRISQMIDLGIVRGLENTSAGVWVGTVDGLVQFRPDGQRVHEWKPPSGRVTAIYADPEETIWVASDRQLFKVVNGQASPVALPVSLAQIETMTSDANGGLWLYDADRGLQHWRESRLTAATEPVDIRQARVLAAYTDRAGRVWMGLSDGRVARFTGDRADVFGKQDGLDAGTYDAFAEDDRGVLWLGANGGLSRFADGHFATLRSSKSFPANGIVAILSDAPGSLWLGGGTGILHVATSEVERALVDSKEKPRFALFDRSDGIAGVPVALGNSRRVIRASDGRVWFMTARGVTILNPTELQQPHDPSAVRIEEVIADGRPLRAEPLMTLPAGTRRLEIHYTVINLTSGLKTRFRYRLEGFDPDWIESDSRRQVYTNLPPRAYVFHVGTAEDSGREQRDPMAWQFSLAPMFYQTPWFYGAVALTLAMVFGVAWQIRLRKVRKEFSLLLGERARIGREIHDTLLQSLVGVSLQCDSIAADLAASGEIKRDKFVTMRKQIQEYIREAHDAIWDLRSGKLQDRDLGTALRESTEQAINGHNIRVHFAAALPAARPLPKIEEQVLKIGKEAVLNAVHHAHPSEISVDLKYDADALTLNVADDGCGFDPNYLNDDRHYGLMSMKERAAVVGGRLMVVTALNHGTSVTAVIPLTSRHA